MQRAPKPYYVFPGMSADAKFKCLKCCRNLPELAFRRAIIHEKHWASMRRATAIHPICKKCCEQISGKHTKHPLYTKAADRFFSVLVSQVKGGAKKRGIAFAIDKDDVLGLYLDQARKCAMTGVEMVLDSGAGHALRNRVRPSIDRIDSAGNYTPDNIQLICSQVNLMKGGMSQVDFLRWCNRIVAHRGSAEDNILAAVS